MQAELMYRKSNKMTANEMSPQHETINKIKNEMKNCSKETIHSGHFMVSDFEAEAQDDEDELAVPVPEVETIKISTIPTFGLTLDRFIGNSSAEKTPQQLSIETSLNKLFQCMSLAYRQKLTSPKWNRFKGIRLRWKDKIRLNNVIWRCWHMQFILKQNTLVCQFASPLDVDTHNKPEAVVLEGKYWKRKLAAVTAEYKKWRMFYRNKILGCNKDGMLESMDMLDWDSGGMGSSMDFVGNSVNSMGNVSCLQGPDSMMVDEDYMELMTDTLFSTISSNQPIYFPDPREIARGASLADFIQPSLGPLQPNLDDFMDTLEPLQEFLNSKLPPVPEEDDIIFRSGNLNSNYSDLDLMGPINQVNNQLNQTTTGQNNTNQNTDNNPVGRSDNQTNLQQNLQYTAKIYTQSDDTNNYQNSSNINDNYIGVTRQNYNESKNRSGKSLARNSRVIQQTQTSFNQNPQVINYQTRQQQQQQQQQSQTQSFNSLDIQLNANSSVNINTPLTNTSQISSIDNQIHNIVTTNFSQTNVNKNTQRIIRSINESENQQQEMTADHFKIVELQTESEVNSKTQHHYQQQTPPPPPPPPPLPQQQQQQQQQQHNYKLSTTLSSTNQSFNIQPCKFRSSNTSNSSNSNSSLKNLSGQNAVTISTSTPVQSHVLLQCKSSGLDLTAPGLHQAKLLPRPTNFNDKDEYFAVPKYQMKARNRSRSSSALSTARNHHTNQPQLVSAVSDPALNLNNNVLLAHLLTNSTSNLYTVTSGPDKIITATVTSSNTNTGTIQNQTTNVKTILPMLPPTNPITIQTLSGQTVQSANINCINTNQQSQQQQNSNPESPKDLTNVHSPGLSISPLHSPLSIGSPLSPSSRIYVKGETERGQYKEQRRVGHIHAEQKRRYNIKNGFDMLHSLIPQLNQNPNTKLSKAAMLQKGADYIKQLRSERNQLKDEMDNLRHQIECLNTSISNCQSMLPATGAPISRQRTNKMKEMFDEYVRKRTQENWKFWIFSILLEPLMISFNTSVSTASVEDLCRSTILWVEQHCSLVDLRPAVLNSLRYLCTATEILSDPARLPEEALAAVNCTNKRSSNQ